MIPSRAIVTGLCVLACAAPIGAAPPEHSISTSRQFLVFGTDVRLRGAICDLAEGAKDDILRLTDQRDAWTTPIVIHVQYPQANLPEMPRASLSLGQTGCGLRLQLDLKMASGVTQPEIRRELLSAALLEMMYRRVPGLPAGTTYVQPPEWLLDGLQARATNMPDSRAPSVAAQEVLPLEEFLQKRPNSLDALSRSLYRAYSAALLERIIRLPDGRGRVARFIFDLPSGGNDTSAHFRRHFPELFDTTGNSPRIKQSQCAQPPAGQSNQLLSGEESERILGEMLSLRIPGAGSGKKYQLSEFPMFVRNSLAKTALARLRWDLRVLVARANPIYRSVISEYERLVTQLARRRTHGIAERLSRLRASRKVLAARVRSIGDYMNWFEAAESETPSGLFTDFMKAADLADSEGERQRDPISVYLDALQTQFQD